jgi:hypothetical protein
MKDPEIDADSVAAATAFLTHQRIHSSAKGQVRLDMKKAHRSLAEAAEQPVDRALERTLDSRRCELLIQRYLEHALMPAITVEAIERGIPVARESLDYPMRAALIVLELLKYRAKLLGLNRGDDRRGGNGRNEEEDYTNPQDVMNFLRAQIEFVQTMVQRAPRDVVTLEVNTEIDGSRGNGNGN